MKKILLTPYYVVANTAIGLRDAADQIFLFLGLKREVRRRRNKDFERAGRESVPRMHNVDAAAASALKNVHRERASESLDAGLRERRILGGKNDASKELRETMATENKSVSSGSVVGHLAKMQRKSSPEPEPEKPITDDSTSETGPAQPSRESPD